jgi:hypothetical protein
MWACFWAVFLATPVVSLLAIRSGGLLPILSIGTISGGYVLSKLFARSGTDIFLTTVLFSIGLFVVYAGIAFAGCLVVLTKLGDIH